MKYFLRSFSSLPLIYPRRVVVSYKRKNVREVLVNRFFKNVQEKGVISGSDCPDMTVAVYWYVKQKTNQPTVCLLIFSQSHFLQFFRRICITPF